CVDDAVSLFSGCVSFTEQTQADETELPKPETTGLAKGVMITHKGLVTSIAQKVDGENSNFNLTEHDVILCFLPMFHTYALNSLILPAIRLVQRTRFFPVAPPVVLAFVKSPETERYDLISVRMMMSAAATLRKELEDAARCKFPMPY
ncbi:hypothetical protein DY000_02042120, partial [Brassica cretica]